MAPQSERMYRLVSVLLYSGTHYVADVLWPDNQKKWIRFDGRRPYNGLGFEVATPSGTTVNHGGATYHPVFLFYVRMP